VSGEPKEAVHTRRKSLVVRLWAAIDGSANGIIAILTFVIVVATAISLRPLMDAGSPAASETQQTRISK
jgi:hypothetical protein